MTSHPQPRLGIPPRDDHGVALAAALLALVAFLGLALIVTVVGFRAIDITGTGRERAVSFVAAETGIDLAVGYLSGSDGGNLPCTLHGALDASGRATYDVTIAYYNTYPVLTAPMPCTGNRVQWDGTRIHAPQAALITSLGTPAPARNGTVLDLEGRRKLQTLVALTAYDVDVNLDKAIFSNDFFDPSNAITVNAGAAAYADVYTNGNLDCSNSTRINGNIIVYGDVTLSNTCTVDGTAWAHRDEALMNNVLVGEDGKSVGGNVKIDNNAKIGRNVYAGKKFWAWGGPYLKDTIWNVGGTIRTDADVIDMPKRLTFPTIEWLGQQSESAWRAYGYTNFVYATSCTDAYDYITRRAKTEKDKTVLIVGACKPGENSAGTFGLQFSNQTDIRLNTDLAVISDDGFTTNNNFTVTSTKPNQTRSLYWIVPTSSPRVESVVPPRCKPSGPPYNYTPDNPFNPGNITLSNRTMFDKSNINVLLYTPCRAYVSNLSDMAGQVYAGVVDVQNHFSMNFVPMFVPGARSDDSFLFNVSLIFKREIPVTGPTPTVTLTAPNPTPTMTSSPGPTGGGGGPLPTSTPTPTSPSPTSPSPTSPSPTSPSPTSSSPSPTDVPTTGTPTPTTTPTRSPSPTKTRLDATGETLQVGKNAKTTQIDVLANDRPTLGTGIQVTAATTSHGSIAAYPDDADIRWVGNGNVFVTPPKGYTGTITVTYTITDPDGNTGTGTLTITVD